jgi:hypothetical protein
VEIQQIEIEEKNIDGESKIEEECGSKEHPKVSAQLLGTKPRGRIPPWGHGAATIRFCSFGA